MQTKVTFRELVNSVFPFSDYFLILKCCVYYFQRGVNYNEAQKAPDFLFQNMFIFEVCTQLKVFLAP
jgi:hypothetical protein